MSTLLIRRHRPIGEPPEIEAAIRAGTRLVEAPLPTGRIRDVLDRIAPELAPAPVEPVSQWLPDLEAPAAATRAVDLGRRFAVVILASHLVNTPSADLRTALLGAAARHLSADGRLLLEHHPTDWLETAAESWTEHATARLGMVDVRVDPPFVSAVSVYDVAARSVRQPFRARVLSEGELREALTAAGLVLASRRSETWLEARPGQAPSLS